MFHINFTILWLGVFFDR